MRQLDGLDNGTFKANMERLCKAIDRNTEAIEKIAEYFAPPKQPKQDFSEEYITLLKQENDLFTKLQNDEEDYDDL